MPQQYVVHPREYTLVRVAIPGIPRLFYVRLSNYTFRVRLQRALQFRV